MSVDIWPEVDVTDSEEESETPKSKQVEKKLDIPEGLTEEEINGTFPVLKTDDISGESSEEEEETQRKEPVNPYLTKASVNFKKKYSEKLRSLHLKRVCFIFCLVTYILVSFVSFRNIF